MDGLFPGWGDGGPTEAPPPLLVTLVTDVLLSSQLALFGFNGRTELQASSQNAFLEMFGGSLAERRLEDEELRT